jgi:hypothetical protein
MTAFAWSIALGGLALGALASLVPGFPGCAVALLGLAAFAGLTDFAIVSREALAAGGAITAVGAGAQLLAPITTNRALGGSAGSATGAALGVVVGFWVPIPGAAWALGLGGAFVGAVVGVRQGVTAGVRGVAGTAAGCFTGVAMDFAAVVALAGLLAACDWRAALGA